jgi:hypothetical protein
VLGQRVGGVVAGGDHGRHQELPDAQGVARHEADVAVRGVREGGGLLGDGDLFLEVRLLESHEGDHDLGRRGHREPRRGVFPGEIRTTPDVGEHRDEVEDVLLKAIDGGVNDFVYGPNWTSVFSELQDQWAKIVTKDITVVEALENMQRYAVDDLEALGINVIE